MKVITPSVWCDWCFFFLFFFLHFFFCCQSLTLLLSSMLHLTNMKNVFTSTSQWKCVRVCDLQVPRHPGPPYQGHDLGKGHAPSPALSQVSAPPAPTYRYLKGWEPGGAVSVHLSLAVHLIYTVVTSPVWRHQSRGGRGTNISHDF